MNALSITFPVRATILVLWADERGLLRPLITRIDCDDIARWRAFDGAKLKNLLGTVHPSRTILSCEWVDPSPYRFDIRDLVPDVVLVKVPGNIGRPLGVALSTVEKYRRRDEARKRKVSEEHWDAGSVRSYKDRLHDFMRDTRASVPVPVDTSTEVVAKCCGISHTAGSYRSLELLGARDWTEGFTALHEERRACGACKATLVVITKRLLGEGR